MTREHADIELPFVARPHCPAGMVEVVAARVRVEEYIIDATVQHHELLRTLEVFSGDEERVL